MAAPRLCSATSLRLGALLVALTFGVFGCSEGSITSPDVDAGDNPFKMDVIEFPPDDKPPSDLDAPPLEGDGSVPPEGEYPMSGLCGNGTVEGDESCDTGDPMRECAMIAPGVFTGGMATCSSGCSWDLTACEAGSPMCGDGITDPSEDCEPSTFTPSACAAPQYTGGMLRCTNCRIDYTGCTRAMMMCGNSMVEGAEQCDDGNTNNNDECSNDCRIQFVQPPNDAGVTEPPVQPPVEPPEPPRPPEAPGVGVENPANPCNNDTTRRAARSNTVLKVTYRLLVCQRPNGTFARTNAEVCQAMEGVRAAMLRWTKVLPVEFDLQPFMHPTCEALYEDNSLHQRLATAAPPGVIPIAFFTRIQTQGSPFPVAAFAAYRRFVAVGQLRDDGNRIRTDNITHELGHFLGLAHTHDCSLGRESTATCATTGDRMCDTPPDRGPRGLRGLSTCNDGMSLTGSCDRGLCRPLTCDARGCGLGRCDDGSRPQRSNFMSYYNCLAEPSFTASQSDWVRCSLTHELTAFNRGNACGDGVCDRYEDITNCRVDCPSACMGETDTDDNPEGPSCDNRFGAWGNATVNVAYYPYRVLRDTDLLTGDPACVGTASTGRPGRVVARLRAGARFGVQSTRNPNCINAPPMRPTAILGDGRWFRFGYAPDATGDQSFGWVRGADIQYEGADPSQPCMTGPGQEDFQVAQNPYRGCVATACSDNRRACRAANPMSENDDPCMGGRGVDRMGRVSGNSYWPMYFAPGVSVKRFVHGGDTVRVLFESGNYLYVHIVNSQCPRFSPENTVGWIPAVALQ